MKEVATDTQNHIHIISLNRPNKHNALNNTLLLSLQQALEEALQNAHIRIIILKAEGRHFSAGADLEWMKQTANLNEEDNAADALILSKVLYTLYTCSKPTLAMVQGLALGGGAGLVAACDIVFAAEDASFGFPETRLGLIPAVISPYVVQAIGARAATWLFTSAERINAKRAQELRLIHHIAESSALFNDTLQCAKNMCQLAPQAVRSAKALVRHVMHKPIDNTLMHETAALIAAQRISVEGQRGMQAFINKEIPNWDE